MSAIIYSILPSKKINGTLFYCFEYYAFLKQYLPDLKYFLLGTPDSLAFVKSVFLEKYTVDPALLDDVCLITRTALAVCKLKSLMVLDVRTHEQIKDFTKNIQQVRVYSNKKATAGYPHHTFYGWYDNFQTFTIRTRLKFYTDIHTVFGDRGNKTFISVLNCDAKNVAHDLNIPISEVYVKELNTHHTGLFQNINRIIYWHSGHSDTNNRIIVESYIHNIPLEIYYNNHFSDSIYERATTLQSRGLQEFKLSLDDVLITDFLHDNDI